MSGNRIPIEGDEPLLSEYGRAFAWCNLVEQILEDVIRFKGGLYRAD